MEDQVIRLYEYDYDKPELSDDTLEHHGIKGQKWGVRNGPPYPLSRGKSSGGRAVRYGSGSGAAKRKARKLQKTRVKSLKKARKVREQNKKEAQQRQRTKEEILESKDLTEILKNKDLFTTKELQDINLRQITEANLSDFARKQADARKTPTEKAVSTVKKAVAEGVSNAVTQMIKSAASTGTKLATQRLATELTKNSSDETKRVVNQLLQIQQENKKKK